KEGARDLDERIADPSRAAARVLTSELTGVFNGVSLTPYTDFVTKALAFVECLQSYGRLADTDTACLLGAMLVKLCRHLTAYDLVTFHHEGANYPDALLLDAALKLYLGLIDRSPGQFHSAPGDDDATRERKQRLRRALRQA